MTSPTPQQDLREAFARMLGSWTVTGGGSDDDDREVIHDVFPGDYDQRTCRLYALTDALLALISSTRGGWRVVPVEPTDAMLDAAGAAWPGCIDPPRLGGAWSAWVAFLAAAPSPDDGQIPLAEQSDPR